MTKEESVTDAAARHDAVPAVLSPRDPDEIDRAPLQRARRSACFAAARAAHPELAPARLDRVRAPFAREFTIAPIALA